MSSKRTDSRLDYELRVENFGKLSEAEIRVGDFTVLAGPNNTGKSFVSKLLYSIFSALDADLPRVRVWRLVSSFTREVENSEDAPPITDQLRPMAVEMERAALAYTNREIDSLGTAITQLDQWAFKMKAVIDKATRGIEESSNLGKQRLWHSLSELRESLRHLTSALEGATGRRTFALAELQYRVKRAVTMNFQVSDLASLATDPERKFFVNVTNLLRFTASGDSVTLIADDTVPALPTGYQHVVFIESPVYWKLFVALQGVGTFAPLFRRSGRELLAGVPDYFYDLAEALKRKYTGEMAFPDVYRGLVCKDVIGGKVAVSESGDIVFEEAGRSFPLVTAAAGVANIGVLAMLIERKVIDHGTMLFIDEPEAHLHPAWQVVVAQALFQLAREGVRVVLATHSLDILKWLEVHLKENPDEEKHVALNRFPDPVFDGEDVATKLGCIKEDLTKPFVDLYLRGL